MIASATLFGLCGAALIGLGLYGFVVQAHLLRRLIAFNIIGSGIFLLFGASGARDQLASTDPVAQALIITGIVVALAATAFGVGLVLAFAKVTGQTHLPEESDARQRPLKAGLPDRSVQTIVKDPAG
ncbi:NADH-quinone oxidoreductase subunit K [Blastomonas aquatica]|uniref:Na+/H+ antiporter subunit C n=1 Tax=Blastomonas aquatica TaxID=1510276 RepID=A0ABQ1JKL1_9SPHN|nr:NADH-quinone oxidoreductase subunit K [Blastomonas aquatica]GGB69084.1 hypothetical protein GCM10010833_25390 [Blastomonas aquatica]